MGLSRSASGILGQVGAGVLVATVGPALALAVDAASFAASAWSLALLRPTGTVRIGQGTSLVSQLAAGWVEFRSRAWLWASVLHLSLLNLVVLAPISRARSPGRPALAGGCHRLGDDRHRLCHRHGSGLLHGGCLSVLPERSASRRAGSVCRAR